MSEEKARVILAYDVFKKIKWFTYNYTQEIGGVGTVKIKEKDGDKYFYVYNIFFPKQTVTGATVHFTPEGWGEIIKTLPVKELGRLNFYWHRHPGSASHSSTDEEDTFETFMGKEADRPYFIFLQTALKFDKTMDKEARVELRKPIRATISDKDVEIKFELPPADKELEKECNKIIETCITKEYSVPEPISKTNWSNNIQYHRNTSTEGKSNFWCNTCKYFHPTGECLPKQTFLNEPTGKNLEDKTEDAEIDAVLQMFNVEKNGDYIDNDVIGDEATYMEDKVSLEFSNGCITILSQKHFNMLMPGLLSNEKQLKPLVSQHKVKEMDDDKDKGFKKWTLQPKRKCYDILKKRVIEVFLSFNKLVMNRYKKEGEENKEDEIPKIEEEKKENSGFDIKIILNPENTTIDYDPMLVTNIICEVEAIANVKWVTPNYGKISSLNGREELGTITATDGYTSAKFTGHKIMKEVETMLENYQAEGWYNLSNITDNRN